MRRAASARLNHERATLRVPSVFYLLLVAVTILAQPFLQDVSPIELMHRSNLWLGPLQGLTAGVLAAFFRSG